MCIEHVKKISEDLYSDCGGGPVVFPIIRETKNGKFKKILQIYNTVGDAELISEVSSNKVSKTKRQALGIAIRDAAELQEFLTDRFVKDYEKITKRFIGLIDSEINIYLEEFDEIVKK